MYLKELDNILSLEECNSLIFLAESKGFEKAPFNDSLNSEIRKSSRVIITDIDLADKLYERIKTYIPSGTINPYFRFLKYTKGDEFKPHTDGNYYDKKSNKISKLTLLIYLNQDYKGGYTTFNKDGNWFSITPKIGKVVLQDQRILHAVFPLEEGIKYVVRTDIMFNLK
jgi:prolyl 4-hydroxylase